MLSDIFPRHVIEYFSATSAAAACNSAAAEPVGGDAEAMGRLARSHEGVTILFMDIVGE